MGAYDHQGMPWACDWNYQYKGIVYFPTAGQNSIFSRCLYKKHTHEYVLEYFRQFLEAYNDQEFVYNMDFVDGHETTLEVLKKLDQNLFKLLKELDEAGLIDDLVINLFSDHGHHMYFMRVFNIEQYFSEINLPLLITFLPDYLVDQIKEDQREVFFE